MTKVTKPTLTDLLESVDQDMNKMKPENYSRLLERLAHILHTGQMEPSDFFITEEETVILRIFLEHENTRPVILARVYSRVIKNSFKIHYSV